MTQALWPHGGNLQLIEQHAPHAPKPWLDLSTGINPQPYPLPAFLPTLAHRLPPAQQVQAAYQAAAAYYGALCQSYVTLAAGMQPLLLALAAQRLAKHGAAQVHIVAPTYAQHQTVWQSLGHTVQQVPDLAGSAAASVVIVCNPNNPDGQQFCPTALHALAQQLATHNGWLIIDESFADTTPALSMVPQVAQQDNVIVLRSLGKFFGVAGLRVSACVASQQQTTWLRTAVGPWPISGMACQSVPLMLQNTAWIAATRQTLQQQQALWRPTLAPYFNIVGHTPLFCLLTTPQAAAWHKHLLQHGILTRVFDYNRHWLRIGLPAKAHWPRLQQALSAFA